MKCLTLPEHNLTLTPPAGWDEARDGKRDIGGPPSSAILRQSYLRRDEMTSEEFQRRITRAACKTGQVEHLWAPDLVRAILSEIDACGLQIVPRIATVEMLAAGKVPTRTIDLGNGTTAQGFGLGASADSI